MTSAAPSIRNVSILRYKIVEEDKLNERDQVSHAFPFCLPSFHKLLISFGAQTAVGTDQ